jgi:hypothetical protein
LDIRVMASLFRLVINDSRLHERSGIARFEFTFRIDLWRCGVTHHDPGRAGVIGSGQ